MKNINLRGGGGYTESLACSPILVTSAAYTQMHFYLFISIYCLSPSRTLRQARMLVEIRTDTCKGCEIKSY